jgi:hypothetical protein
MRNKKYILMKKSNARLLKDGISFLNALISRMPGCKPLTKAANPVIE